DEADGEHEVVYIAQLWNQQCHPLKEVVSSSCDPEKARQLSHGDGQPGTYLKAHENAVADKLDEHAQSRGPGNHAKQCHREPCETGNVGLALGIAASHVSDRPRYHERDGRSRSDCELPR